MNTKRIIALLMSMAILCSFTACKGDEEPTLEPSTVTGGSAEDVFELGELAENGEDITVDANLIDEDSGLVTTGSSGTATTTKKTTTTTPNIKQETTVSGNVAASSTQTGYKLSWAAVSGAKKYNVYRADTKDGTYTYLGSTTDTYYVDKNGGSNYFYKITVAKDTSSSGTSASNYIGSTTQFKNTDGGQTFISTNLNNTYVAFVRNQYAKKGITCPAGRLAYVQISDSPMLYVFQFDNTKTWNSATLEQVHIFDEESGTSAYFSFFTKNEGSADYLAAKADAEAKWAQNSGSEGATYEEQQEFFLLVAADPNFQEIIDASYA